MSAHPFPNGASVNRVYGNMPEGEMLAAFAYSTDAEAFAKAKLAEDASRDFKDSFYAVSCHYSGKLTLVRHEQVPA